MWRLGEGSELVRTEMERKPWGMMNNSEKPERLLCLRCAERAGCHVVGALGHKTA